MRKVLLPLVACLYFFVQSAMAQNISVSGRVLAASDNLALPGVSVRIKNTNQGTSTDAEGRYSISVAPGQILVFSIIGFTSVERSITANSKELNITMQEDAKQLAEVVVTALGERRQVRALGYAATEIKGDNLSKVGSTDINTALTGKVAGVQLNGSPSSTFDNAAIIVRGINGFTVGEPLYVIDGTPTSANNINLNNIESITVLKGAAATALYGQRGYNGVVIITSKKGSLNQLAAIEVNSSLAFEKVSLMPDYQNEYAGGYTSEWMTFKYDPTIHPPSFAPFDGRKILDYSADASFGPKIDGSMYMPYYGWYPGADFGALIPLNAQPNNVKDFLRTGGNFINGINFSKGGEDYAIRVGYTNQSRTLIQEKGSRSLNMLNFNGSYNVIKQLKVVADLQFGRENRIGQPYEGYRNDGLNIIQGFNQWFQRQLDMNYMKANQTLANGYPTSWNILGPNGNLQEDIIIPQYWDNPFWVVNHNYRTRRNNRFVGSAGLIYDFGGGIEASVYARGDINNQLEDERMATGGLEQDYYKIRNYSDTEYNYDVNLNYNKIINDFNVSAFLSGSLRQERRERLNMSTQGGLSFPNYFNMSASRFRPYATNSLYTKQIRSVLGRLSASYKNFIYVDVTGRNDWSSVFATDLNSYFYPSASLSFIASEFFDAGTKSIINYAKLRAAFAQVGSDVDPYRVNIQYNTSPSYEAYPAIGIGNEFRDGRIRPALTSSLELGAEMRFLQGRLGLDFAWYLNKNKDQILAVVLNGATGYTTNLINAGELSNRGIELAINATPLKSKNLQWDINLNFSKSKTTVNKITEKQTNAIYKTSRFFTTTLNLWEGKEWGYLLGKKFNRDEQGRMIILPNGLPSFSPNEFVGYARPKWTGGLYSTLKFYDFDFSFSLDFQKGGLFNSTTRAFNLGSGLSKETIGLNDRGVDWRLPVSQGGGYKFDGVLANGQPNEKYVEASAAFYNGMQNGSGEMFLISASYLKLREVRLGYTLPAKTLANIGFLKTANIAFTLGNAWLISAPAKKYGVDPSELEDFWEEGGQLPPTRTFGINLKLGF